MEVIVEVNKSISNYDTGGGTREVKAVITIDENLSPHNKRKVVLYETIGCCLDFVLPHEQMESLAETLLSALDQLEPL